MLDLHDAIATLEAPYAGAGDGLWADVYARKELKWERIKAHCRLRVETRKWVASKLLPKVYGDKLQHTGDGGGPIQVDLSVALTDALTKARKHEQRIGSDETED